MSKMRADSGLANPAEIRGWTRAGRARVSEKPGVGRARGATGLFPENRG